MAPTTITADTANWLVHPFSGAVGAIILSAAVRALPEPGSTGNPFAALYAWFFRFANGILANFDLAKPASLPPSVPPVAPLVSTPAFTPLPLHNEAGSAQVAA